MQYAEFCVRQNAEKTLQTCTYPLIHADIGGSEALLWCNLMMKHKTIIMTIISTIEAVKNIPTKGMTSLVAGMISATTNMKTVIANKSVIASEIRSPKMLKHIN